MKTLLILSLLAISFSSFAQIVVEAEEPIALQFNDAGKSTYVVRRSKRKFDEVSPEFVEAAAADLYEKAKKIACGLKMRPTMVSASLGIIGFEWETSKLCE